MAAHLERLDRTVIDLETEMMGINPKSESGKQVLSSLEKALKEAETKLEAELKKLSVSFYYAIIVNKNQMRAQQIF